MALDFVVVSSGHVDVLVVSVPPQSKVADVHGVHVFAVAPPVLNEPAWHLPQSYPVKHPPLADTGVLLFAPPVL